MTKRWQRDLSKVEWYQEQAELSPILCPQDGEIMRGDSAYGTVFLACPVCDFRIRQVPDAVFKEYYQRVIMQE